ncbi:hypothetical protein CXG81DRAFT_18500 [Caulochytrium protostelioides]|uniref:Uncharacterized protein n=1 Tax=Caulochytrium protostelioides TaxID=1555241 RepID=A0A4P9X8Z0_9FUNG|nr:hypothetical protein CXG81DRAFT_18500 [Caulochytrium protostelioides]|eukprot:RKP01742.1 hypothetical protein CXG81DRAFT_18500 [Caulochytrium protostelioides]
MGMMLFPPSGGHWPTRRTWRHALLRYIENPAAWPEVCGYDDDLVVVRDAYPRARHHYLILPRVRLDRLSELEPSTHGALLAAMRDRAHVLIRQLRAGEASPDAGMPMGPPREACNAPLTTSAATSVTAASRGPATPVETDATQAFAVGFHAVPSMAQLHLHVVSRDYAARAMRSRLRWNAFTTAYFLPLSAVQSELHATGRITIDDVAMRKIVDEAPIRCHRCHSVIDNMAQLQQHLAACTAPVDNLM